MIAPPPLPKRASPLWRLPDEFEIQYNGSDETDKLQAFVDSLGPGDVAMLPPGRGIVYRQPLRWWGKSEVSFLSSGVRSLYPDVLSGLIYQGPEGTPAVQLYNAHGISWKGVKVFYNRGGARRQSAFDVDQFGNGGTDAVTGAVIPGGVTSDIEIGGCALVSDGSSANAAAVWLARTSADNVEGVTLDRVAAHFRDREQRPADSDRGSMVRIGGGGPSAAGSNAKDITLERCRCYGARSFVRAGGGAELAVRGGLTQWSMIDFDLAGNTARIERLRSENQRQFLVGSGRILLDSNAIAGGAHDRALPVVKVLGRTDLTMLGNAFDPEGSEIVSVDADPAGQCTYFGDGANRWAHSMPDFSRFSRGAVCGTPWEGLAMTLNGAVRHMGVTRAELPFCHFGEGTEVFVRDARPGCADLLDAAQRPQGSGAKAIFAGGRWQSYALGA